MGMMSMNDNNMVMMAQEMNNSEKGMLCDRCEKDPEEIAITTNTNGDLSVQTGMPILFSFWRFNIQANEHNSQNKLILSSTGPPVLTDTLVGTVILRT